MFYFIFQTVETDGISSSEAFIIDDVQYLIITNKGNHNRYETYSRLYRVNNSGQLLLVRCVEVLSPEILVKKKLFCYSAKILNSLIHCLVSSVGRAFVCESSDLFWFHLQLFTLYHCLGMYRSNLQFFAKVKATGTGKLLDSLPREGVMTKLCSGEFNMALPWSRG